MKKHLVLVACMMAGVVVMAQERSEKDRRPHRDVATQMKEELSLSEEQYTRIKAIDEAYRAKFKEFRKEVPESGKPDADGKRQRSERPMMSKEDREKMIALRKEQRKEVEAVLTPEQKAEWESKAAARRDHQKARFERMKTDRYEKIRQDLSLSDKQLSEVKKAGETFRTGAMELKKQSLGEEQRKAEFRKLRDRHDAAMKKILNKDQYKKWTEMKKDHRGGKYHRGSRQQG